MSQKYEIMKMLINSTQRQTKLIVSKFLKRHYEKVVETKQYVYAEGDIPIALTAHLDTVFENLIPKGKELFYDKEHEVMYSPFGAGFDDKAGVFAILQIVRSGLRPHIIFTTGEEEGAAGAYALAASECPFTDLRYIIELDRQGKNDCVFYDCNNPEFTNYIESFGFATEFGTFSDISVLCPAWKVAGVNLSVGYLNEHSSAEVLYVKDLQTTIEKVKMMLAETDIPSFHYIEAKRNKHIPFKSIGIVDCDFCGKAFLEDDSFPVETLDGKTAKCCANCLSNVNWCRECGTAFESDSTERELCDKCTREIERWSI